MAVFTPFSSPRCFQKKSGNAERGSASSRETPSRTASNGGKKRKGGGKNAVGWNNSDIGTEREKKVFSSPSLFLLFTAADYTLGIAVSGIKCQTYIPVSYSPRRGIYSFTDAASRFQPERPYCITASSQGKKVFVLLVILIRPDGRVDGAMPLGWFTWVVPCLDYAGLDREACGCAVGTVSLRYLGKRALWVG